MSPAKASALGPIDPDSVEKAGGEDEKSSPWVVRKLAQVSLILITFLHHPSSAGQKIVYGASMRLSFRLGDRPGGVFDGFPYAPTPLPRSTTKLNRVCR